MGCANIQIWHKKFTSATLETQVARFLFNYRMILQTTTGFSLSELLFDCHLCCHLDLLHPNFEAKVCQNQYWQKDLHNFYAREQVFVEGDSVLVSTGDP